MEILTHPLYREENRKIALEILALLKGKSVDQANDILELCKNQIEKISKAALI